MRLEDLPVATVSGFRIGRPQLDLPGPGELPSLADRAVRTSGVPVHARALRAVSPAGLLTMTAPQYEPLHDATSLSVMSQASPLCELHTWPAAEITYQWYFGPSWVGS